MKGPKSTLGRLGGVLAAALVTAAASPAAAQQDALDELRSAAQSSPRDAGAHRAYGLALLRAGELRKAERQLEKAARLAGNSLEALYDVARVAFARGEYRPARNACRPLERKERNAVLTRVCRARAFLVWNRAARAFEELEAALDQDSDHFETLLALGDAHRLRASVDKADEAYRKAARQRPGSAKPYLGLGRLHAAAGHDDEARDALKKAHERDGDDPEILYELGRRTGGARGSRLLEQAVEARPDWAEAHVALGGVRLEAGDAEAAASAYRKAIGLSSRLVPAHLGLGRALTETGEHDEAERALEKTLQLVPNSAEATRALAHLYARTDRKEEAFAKYRHAADLAPSDPTSLLDAVRLALRLERDVLAAGFLDRVLQRHRNLAAALALYGDVMAVRDRRDEAKRYYQRALEGEGPVDRARVRKALRQLDEPRRRGEELQPAMIRHR
ncbi:MAG: tetratricopeptide repeat protein [Polyangiales bacterium]